MSNPRALPPVHKLLTDPRIGAWVGKSGHQVVTDTIRKILDGCRQQFEEGKTPSVDPQSLIEQTVHLLENQSVGHFRTVINATGIILHTNLGRSPLAEIAARAAYDAGRNYTNLELDLETGLRSSRQGPLRELICQLTGAESATVVNNCAAATILVLRSLALGREVIVSRGQLIEIGGSFRLPDIMSTSGATLREVGTTNITRLSDYENAVGPQTAALMRVHTSNFRVKGFTEETSLLELIELGKKQNLPVIDDAGSGALHDPSPYGLTGEPIPQEAIRLGADLTLFSGDKLLGGPQAGIIAGKKQWIHKIEKDPFMRAVRCDKMTLAALEKTLRLHLDPDLARREIPILAMLSQSQESLKAKAETLAAKLTARGISFELTADHAFVGGGTLPEEKLPTWVVRLGKGPNPQQWAKRLRTGSPAVMARIDQDQIIIDPRTVLKDQMDDLVGAIVATKPA